MNINKDSLLRAYRNQPDDLETLNQLSQSYEFTNGDSAIHYAEILLSRSKNRPQYTAKAYHTIANSHLTANHLDKALIFYKKAIEVSEKGNFTYDLAVYQQSLAQAYMNLGNLSEALTYYEYALSYFLKNKNAKQADYLLSVIYGGIGDCYNQLGVYDLSLQSLFNSLNFSQKIKDSRSTAITFISIASVYYTLKEYEKSIHYDSEALEEFKKTSYPLGMATAYLNQAENYFKINKITESLDLLKISEGILNSLKTTYNLGEVYSLYGKIYRGEKDFKKSNSYFKKAFEIHTQSGALIYIGTALLNLAKNQVATGELKSARLNLNNALKIFKENHFLKEEKETLSFIIANKLSHDKELEQYFIDYNKTNDEFLNREKQHAIAAQEIRFQTSQQEAKIAQQKLSIEKEKNRRNLAFGGVIGLLLFSAGGFWLLRSRQKHKVLQTQNKMLSLQQSLNQMQLSKLNAQLDPHEIKNLLASISPEIQDKAPEAYKHMIKLLNITKASLNNTSLTEPVDEQVNQVEDYLSLIKNTLSAPLDYQIENKVADETPLPRLLLKNLVENAVKHGIRGKVGGGSILISIDQKDNYFTVSVNDTGKGRPKSANNDRDMGIGISTYQNFFTVLNTKNKLKARFEIMDKTDGTRVDIMIPKNYSYN
jgi:tetratricopeptide (TPR) repeat protein